MSKSKKLFVSMVSMTNSHFFVGILQVYKVQHQNNAMCLVRSKVWNTFLMCFYFFKLWFYRHCPALSQPFTKRVLLDQHVQLMHGVKDVGGKTHNMEALPDKEKVLWNNFRRKSLLCFSWHLWANVHIMSFTEPQPQKEDRRWWRRSRAELQGHYLAATEEA